MEIVLGSGARGHARDLCRQDGLPLYQPDLRSALLDYLQSEEAFASCGSCRS